MPESIELNFVAEDVLGGEVLQWATSFSNVNDLVDKAIAAAGDKCISRLVIAAHGAEGSQGFMVFDVNLTGIELIDGMNDDQPIPEQAQDTIRDAFARLRGKWCKKAIIEVRVCEFGTGANGTVALQTLADIAGVPVTAPMDEISSLAAIGGLTTNWKTVCPSDWNEPIDESFWRGDPEARPVVPLPGSSIAPVTESSIAPITGSTVTNPSIQRSSIGWKRPAAAIGTVAALGGGGFLIAISGGDSPPDTAITEVVDVGDAADVGDTVIVEDTDEAGDSTGTSGDSADKEDETALAVPEPINAYVNWAPGYEIKLDYLDATFEWDDHSRQVLADQYVSYGGIGYFFSDKNQSAGLTPGEFPELQFQGAASAYHWGSPDQTLRLLGNSEFGCGEIVDGRRTVCAGGAPIEGDYLIAIALLGGEIPGSNPGYEYTYSLVLDADDDAANNYVAGAAFEWDSYQGTDYWIELIGEGENWQLLVTNWAAGDGRGATTSAARAVIWGDMIIFFVPESDLGGSHSHAYRLTSFATLLERAFDPAVSAVDALPGPPDFGLIQITDEKLMAAE